jgi:hypothetical protein
MGLIEARIFVEALRHITQGKNGSKELPPIRIHMSAIIGKDDSAEAYTAVRQACKDLVRRILNLSPVVGDSKDLHEVPLMSEIVLASGTGYITGNFNPKIAPYLIQLASVGNFTSADIATLLTMRHPHSQRLYWILRSWAGMGSGRTHTHQESLDDLKLMLLEDSSLYPVYADFKKRILDPITADFHSEEVGFMVEWAPVKTGKKVTAIKFTIPRDQSRAQPAIAAAVRAAADEDAFEAWIESQSPKLKTAYIGLRSTKGAAGNHLSKSLAQRLIRHVAGNPELEKVLYHTRHAIATTRLTIVDKAAYSASQFSKALNLKL